MLMPKTCPTNPWPVQWIVLTLAHSQTQLQTQARPLCSIMKLKNKLLLLDYTNNNNRNNCNGSESMERKVHYVIRRAQFIAFNGKR